MKARCRRKMSALTPRCILLCSSSSNQHLSYLDACCLLSAFNQLHLVDVDQLFIPVSCQASIFQNIFKTLYHHFWSYNINPSRHQSPLRPIEQNLPHLNQHAPLRSRPPSANRPALLLGSSVRPSGPRRRHL